MLAGRKHSWQVRNRHLRGMKGWKIGAGRRNLYRLTDHADRRIRTRMAKSFNDLLRELRGTREGVLPSIQSFPPLDVDELARQLDLDSRAREAGQRNSPACDSELEDAAELDIRADIEGRARKTAEDYQGARELYEGRIRRALVSTDQRVSVEAFGQNALADFGVQATDELNKLHLAHLELEARERELSAFQRKHRLERLPNDPAPSRRTVSLLFVVFIFLVESMFNGMFFATGSEAGLIGGILQALALSSLNIGAACLYAAYCFRRMIHRVWVIKLVGLALTAAFIIWTLGINLLIAHFRDVFIANDGVVGMRDLMDRLAGAPLDLADPNSWLLGMLGVGLSLVTVIDVIGMDDMYPGFGAVGRRRAAAVRTYTADKASSLRGLEATRDKAVGEMLEVLHAMKNAEYELVLAIDGRSNLHRHLRAFLDHAADTYVRLSQRYREANQRARSDACVPARFKTPPSRPKFLTADPLDVLSELAKDERGLVVQRMDFFIQGVNRKYEETASRFDTVREITRPGENDDAPS